MLFFCINCNQSQKIYVTAKQKRNDILALLSALTLQLNFYYLDVFLRYLKQYRPISIWNMTIFKPDLCLMMTSSRNQYCACCWERHIDECSEAPPTYREKNYDEINARHRNARRRNVALSGLHNENEYLGETVF